MARITRDHLALYAAALAAKGLRGPLHAPLPRRAEHSRAPLSRAQERLFFLELYEPGTPLYNDAVAGYMMFYALLSAGQVLVGPQIAPLLKDNGTTGLDDIYPGNINAPLSIGANTSSGDLTGGDPANSIVVSVAYFILNTTTGVFE